MAKKSILVTAIGCADMKKYFPEKESEGCVCFEVGDDREMVAEATFILKSVVGTPGAKLSVHFVACEHERRGENAAAAITEMHCRGRREEISGYDNMIEHIPFTLKLMRPIDSAICRSF